MVLVFLHLCVHGGAGHEIRRSPWTNLMCSFKETLLFNLALQPFSLLSGVSPTWPSPTQGRSPDSPPSPPPSFPPPCSTCSCGCWGQPWRRRSFHTANKETGPFCHLVILAISSPRYLPPFLASIFCSSEMGATLGSWSPDQEGTQTATRCSEASEDLPPRA